MNEKDKEWIDNATYEELLRKWRFAPLGERIFIGESGEYYRKVMLQKKYKLPHNEVVKASKNVGW